MWFKIADFITVEKEPHHIFLFDNNIILFLITILFLTALSEKIRTWDKML